MSNKELLRSQEPTFLTKAKRTGYICPACGNGSGRDGDGITRQPNTHSYKCFKCGFYGDIIDLFGLQNNITDEAEKFKKCREYFGIEADQRNETKRKEPETPPVSEQEEDFTAFFQEAERNNDFTYLRGRGISEAVQKRFHIGFVKDWKSPKAVKTTLERGGNPANLPSSPRCIIPRSRSNYLARDTRENLTDDEKRFEKQNQGKTVLFNIQALKTAETVFVVEGEIDVMSIYETGGEGIGLCSTANVNAFLNLLKDHYNGQVFILMLDNDESGRKAQKELADGLDRLEIPFIEAGYSEHDPNDLLKADKEQLTSLISSLQVKARDLKQEAKGNQYNAGELLNYFRTIEKQPAGFEAKTGFEGLDRPDRNLYGGLHEGLYIIGAISSLGKTTFCLQMADQIAEKGQDVLFFSLEQSKFELIAKSISRHSYLINREKKDREGHFIARETTQVLNNRRYSFYTAEEKNAIAEAIEAYSKQAENLYIYEGRYKGERLTVQHIRQIVKNHIESTGRTPVVFIDYLQIIAPADLHSTDKQNTDTAVFELKEISRDFKIPVFVISSFNRENYLEPVSMTSFKESGAVEYSSDVLFGLQYLGMDYDPTESEKERKKRLSEMKRENEGKKFRKEPIKIELKCLKNRNGTQFSLMFYFCSAFNCYEEIAFNPDTDIPPKPKKVI